MSKKGLLVVSFGTSYKDAFEENIMPVEKRIADEFHDREMRRAFGSKFIIKKLASRDGVKIDTIAEALESFAKDGFTDVLVQPTFIIPGTEYDWLLEACIPFKNRFEKLSVGKPFIFGHEDYEAMIEAIPAAFYPARPDAALILMGHGSEHFANAAYPALEHILLHKGQENVFVATVEGYPSFEQVRQQILKKGIKTVTMLPLMLVAGDHAKNDMAGDDEDSWKSILTADGLQVNCVLKGLGCLESVQRHFADHAKAAEEE